MHAPPEPPPAVRLLVTDALERSRPSVLFRLLLALPHLVWLSLWTLAAAVAVVAAWLATIVRGRPPRGLHGFLSAFVRYSVHVSAYLYLAAQPFPRFTGAPGYPVDLQLPPPVRQRRITVAFRLVLALPALLLSTLLAGGPGSGWGGGSSVGAVAGSSGAVGTAAFLAWFACLARGRAPRGLRDLIAYGIGYAGQVAAYVLLLTDRYPSADPARIEPPCELPEHPVRLDPREELRRSRLTVLFRLPLTLPHLVWLALWTAPALAAALCAWAAALAAGRVPLPLHRFLAAYVRYAAHVVAFVTVVGGLFPGFAGAQGSYPVELRIAPPARQSRWTAGFRLLLALPALLLSGTLGTVLSGVAFLGWWAALLSGRMPAGLRDLGAACIRYQAQTHAYLLLASGRYPYAAPAVGGPRRAEEGEPALAGAAS